MNPRLERLQLYPFERLRTLLAGVKPAARAPIAMSIGEPRHEAPSFVLQALSNNLEQLGSYPTTVGLPTLRAAIARWLQRRFALPLDSVDPERMVLPVNGTREALFAFAQAVISPSEQAVVVMPNPFYQIYEGAAQLAGAEPYFLNAKPDTGFLPDLNTVPAAIWRRCQLLYLCSPGNPTGAVADIKYLQHALELADRYDFIIAADECYSEIYADENSPPPGLLQAAHVAGVHEFKRCVVFHSLSKRSSVPGLRSGFVAGDPQVLKKFLLYRTYHGCAMPVPVQLASIEAWNDEMHVIQNRALYREKFAKVVPALREVLNVTSPPASFYLWAEVGDDERFTRELFAQQHITVLPGSYLSRDSAGQNPGAGRVRISLVATVAECVEAAERIRAYAIGRELRSSSDSIL